MKTVMAMVMVMGETMIVKRNSLIFLTAFGLLLTGCSKSGLEITKDDILEVARDDANATKKECENVSIKEQKGLYIISFNTNGGSYEYKIGKDGIIQERNYKRSSSEEKEEVSTSEPVEEKKEETEVETKKEEKKESTSFNKNQQAAIDAALANAGLAQEDVTDIGCTLDKASQQYTVTFTFQDIHNTCMVDAATFTVLSSVQA